MNHDNGTTVKVKVITSVGVMEAEVDDWTYVRDLISIVRVHFNYAFNGYYELELEGNGDEPLKLNRPLNSYPIQNGSVLIMTDLGVAV